MGEGKIPSRGRRPLLEGRASARWQQMTDISLKDPHVPALPYRAKPYICEPTALDA
jgi:hypothetical protein